MQNFKQKIIANIDTLAGKVLSTNTDEMEDKLNDGHLFEFIVNRFRDENGNEYKIMSTITIALAKDSP